MNTHEIEGQTAAALLGSLANTHWGKRIPRFPESDPDRAGMPQDEDLRRLGSRFASVVREDRMLEAADTLGQIEARGVYILSFLSRAFATRRLTFTALEGVAV